MTAEATGSKDPARVTICLVCYQHAAFVQDALDAIARQTCQAFKVIAIDDGSTDGTLEILQKAAAGQLTDKLTVLTHPGHKNQGCYASYRACLRPVDTDYFMPHASDDFLEPHAIESLIALLDANPDADFAYGPCNVVDADGKPTGGVDGVMNIGSGTAAVRQLLAGNPVREPTMCFKRACRDAYLEHPTSVKFGDWYYQFFTFSTARPLRYETPYVNYRVHGSNVSIGPSAEFLQRERRAVFAALLSGHLPTCLQPFEGLLVLGALSHRQLEHSDRAAHDSWRRRLASADWSAVQAPSWEGLPGTLLDRLPISAALQYCVRVNWRARPKELARVLRRVASRVISARRFAG